MIKKIESKKDTHKKHKRNQIIVGIVLIIILFGSVFGIIVNSFGKESEESVINYKGQEFVNSQGLWITSIGEYTFGFSTSPEETIEINGSVNYLVNYVGFPLYIYSEDSDAQIEVARNLGQIAERTQNACINNESCNGDFPIKDCSNNFIIIREGEEKITQENNCVFIEGKKEDLALITDSFLMKIMGIE